MPHRNGPARVGATRRRRPATCARATSGVSARRRARGAAQRVAAAGERGEFVARCRFASAPCSDRRHAAFWLGPGRAPREEHRRELCAAYAGRSPECEERNEGDPHDNISTVHDLYMPMSVNSRRPPSNPTVDPSRPAARRCGNAITSNASIDWHGHDQRPVEPPAEVEHPADEHVPSPTTAATRSARSRSSGRESVRPRSGRDRA